MTDQEADIDYCIGEVAAHLGVTLNENARMNMVKRLAPTANVSTFRVLWGLVETHKGRPFPNPMEIENLVRMRSNREPKGLPPLPKRLPLTTHEVQTEAGELAKRYAGEIIASLKPLVKVMSEQLVFQGEAIIKLSLGEFDEIESEAIDLGEL